MNPQKIVSTVGIVLVILLLNFGKLIKAGESDSVNMHDSVCKEHYGAYARKPDLGIVCCRNKTLSLPDALQENQNLEDCFSNLNQQKGDLPSAMWNVALCIFKNQSAFSDSGDMNFDNYFKFMTNEYPEAISKEIKKVSIVCSKVANKESDSTVKLRKFTECLHSSEKKYCNVPFKLLNSTSDGIDKKYDCPGMVGIMDSSPENRYYCCKKQSLPFDFMNFYLNHQSVGEDLADKVEKCNEDFENKQLELDPNLKAEVAKYDKIFENETSAEGSSENPRDKLIQCQIACQHSPKNYTSKGLSLDFDRVITNLTGMFGKQIQDDLKKILNSKKLSITFKSYSYLKINKDLSFKELDKQFKSAKELEKLKYFCEFANTLEREIKSALHEYCFDKKFAEKWKELYNY